VVQPAVEVGVVERQVGLAEAAQVGQGDLEFVGEAFVGEGGGGVGAGGEVDAVGAENRFGAGEDEVPVVSGDGAGGGDDVELAGMVGL
jgi:hypothetical protein